MLLLCVLFFGDPVNTSQWEVPLMYGTKPIYHEGRLYVYDRFDYKIKVYEGQPDGSDMTFLWQTLDTGRGPGELPKTSEVISLALNEPYGTIWLNHEWGHIIFGGKDGDYRHELKRPKGSVWAVPNGKYLALSGNDVLRDNRLMIRVKRGQREPLWELEQPFPIPVTPGKIVVPRYTELYQWKGHYLTIDTTVGLVAFVNNGGHFEWLVQLEQTLPEEMQPIDFADDYYRDKDTLFSKLDGDLIISIRWMTYPSGFSEYKNRLTVQTLHFCEGVRFDKDELYFDREDDQLPLAKFLTEVDPRTGEKLRWLYHPHLTDNLYLFHQDEHGWYLFDETNGDRIVHVTYDEVRPILFPLN